MPDSTLRLALIGLGNAGTQLHLPALAGMSGVEVVGACDLDENRRALAASRWRVPVYEDFDDMLRRTQPDVVIVGTPPRLHAEYCLRSLASGANVICEKPFVSSLVEADRVIQAARAAGRHVALNHEFREMPITRALLDATTGDDVVVAQVWQMMDLPPWAEPRGWRGQMLQRTLYEAGVHLVDFLLGAVPRETLAVSATISTCGVREEESDAVALATLEFSRAASGLVIQNRLCKGDTLYFEARADTLRGSLRASFGGRARLSLGLFRSPRPHVRIEYGPGGTAWSEVGGKRRQIASNPKNPRDDRDASAFSAHAPGLRDGCGATCHGRRRPKRPWRSSPRATSPPRPGTRVSLEHTRPAELADMQMGATPGKLSEVLPCPLGDCRGRADGVACARRHQDRRSR